MFMEIDIVNELDFWMVLKDKLFIFFSFKSCQYKTKQLHYLTDKIQSSYVQQGIAVHTCMSQCFVYNVFVMHCRIYKQ
jgi:hypothetical protein